VFIEPKATNEAILHCYKPDSSRGQYDSKNSVLVRHALKRVEFTVQMMGFSDNESDLNIVLERVESHNSY
jgi:hypothetical protein